MGSITGPAGNEFVLLVARRSAPVEEADLRELAGVRWPALPRVRVLRLTPDEIQGFVSTRDRDFPKGRPGEVDDDALKDLGGPSRSFGPQRDRLDPEGAVRRRLEELRKRLSERSDHFEGVVFPHDDK